MTNNLVQKVNISSTMNVFETLCRLCTKNSKSTIFINKVDSDKVRFVDKLKFVFSDLLLEEDDLTLFKICLNCCKKLTATYEFKKQCTTSYEYWQVHIQKMKTINKEKYDKVFNNLKNEPGPTPSPLRKRGRPRKVKTEEESSDDLGPTAKSIKIANKSEIKLEPAKIENKSEIKLEPALESNTEIDSKEKLGNICVKPNILNLKNKINALLNPENNIKQEEIIANNQPILLNLNSLKSKLGDALRIGVKNIENEKTGTEKIAKKKLTNKKYFVFDKMVYIIDFKTFYCTSCNKYFPNLKSLKIHIIRDLGIKNIPCKVCKRRFFSHRELKTHLQMHTLVKT